MGCKRGRVRRLLAAVRRLLGFEQPLEPPAEWGWFEPALVPSGPRPHGPRSSAATLELPTELDPLVYPTETDAVGKDDDPAL
jgi:hypothetical protein